MTLEIPPIDDNEDDEYGEDDEDEYEELYESKKNEIEKYIEDNFSKLKFSIHFDGHSLIEWGSENITNIKVNPPINITDSLLDNIDTSVANQVLVKFDLKVTVNYTATVYYVSTKTELNGPEGKAEHISEDLEREYPNSTELDVEVTFSLPKKKKESFRNMAIEIKPIDTDESDKIVVYAVDYEEEYDDERYEGDN
jgi:hypothetical protein